MKCFAFPGWNVFHKKSVLQHFRSRKINSRYNFGVESLCPIQGSSYLAEHKAMFQDASIGLYLQNVCVHFGGGVSVRRGGSWPNRCYLSWHWSIKMAHYAQCKAVAPISAWRRVSHPQCLHGTASCLLCGCLNPATHPGWSIEWPAFLWSAEHHTSRSFIKD